MIFLIFLAYDEKVVAFLKQDGIKDILKDREAEYANKSSLQCVVIFWIIIVLILLLKFYHLSNNSLAYY